MVGERGAYRLGQALPTIQVPATVQTVLAARIDRLPPEDKRLLQTAAVIGTEVPWPLLQAIAEVPEEALHRSITRLQAAEFLYETHLFPEREYTFKHALTHEVAYGSLLQEHRRVLHARIVEVLERLFRPPDRAGRTAHSPCLPRRGLGEGCCLLPSVGAKATARAAYREAVAYLSRRWRPCRVSQSSATPVRRLSISGSTCAMRSFRLATSAVSSTSYARPKALLRRWVIREARAGFRLWIAAFMGRGDPDRALACGQRTLSIAELLGDFLQMCGMCGPGQGPL